MKHTDGDKTHSQFLLNLKRIAEFWPIILGIFAIITFVWEPFKKAADIASQSQLDSLELRVKNVEVRGISLEQSMRLNSISIGENTGRLTPAEVRYYSEKVFRGDLDMNELQLKLYGVSGKSPNH
jgi:hypothetical protein